MNNLGVMRAVASAYVAGRTVGKVDIAPLVREYGRGQSRIIQRSLRPSCFRVEASAINRLSLAAMRSTYRRRIVLETRKEQNEPATVAVAKISHPSQTPYTKPAVVPHVEYPMMGGKAVMNVTAHKMVQPPVVCFHFSAKGSSQPNILSLNTRKRIPKVAIANRAIPARIRCIRVIFCTVAMTRLCNFSALLMRLSRMAVERLVWKAALRVPVDR